MARQQIPRWFVYTGWIMLAVGGILLYRDIAAANSPLERSIGGLGLAIDIVIDLFLIIAGAAIQLAALRNR